MNNIDIVRFIFNDGEVFEVNAQYESFHAIVDGVRMIFYPHTVRSTNNKHLRVRNGTPQRKKDFLELISILQHGCPLGCDFHVKNHHMLWLARSRGDPLHNKEYQQYLENALNIKKEREQRND